MQNVRIYSLAGADLAEKGRIIHMISEIFCQFRQEIFISPFERSLPYAVYIPELNSLVTSVCSNHFQGRLKNRYYDIGQILTANLSPVEEIIGYTMSQSFTYMKKSLELLSISNLLMKAYAESTSELLDIGRLKSYAKRKIGKMIGMKSGGIGKEYYRSVSAITCGGYRFAEFPADYRLIRLSDEYFAASEICVRTMSETANKLGFDTIVSRAVDTLNAPMHLMIPAVKTAFLSESKILGTKVTEGARLNLNRFYSQRLLGSSEHYTEFYGEYIRKMLSESALYARICMDIKNQGRKLLLPYISEKVSSEIASEIMHQILNS